MSDEKLQQALDSLSEVEVRELDDNDLAGVAGGTGNANCGCGGVGSTGGDNNTNCGCPVQTLTDQIAQ
jgi:hypothetical protein